MSVIAEPGRALVLWLQPVLLFTQKWQTVTRYCRAASHELSGGNKELHITSHRACFAKLNLLSCFSKGIQHRALSCPPQELQIIALLSVPIILSHYSLPVLYSVLLYSIQYICILIIFHNIDEETLCSCFRTVMTIG